MKQVKLSTLHLNPRNPRTISVERFQALVKSLKNFPAMMELRPIIVDKSGMVIGGNMRYRALKELGYATVPAAWVKRADKLTKAELRRFVVMDNEPFGVTDDDMLAADYELVELEEWGVSLPEMDDEDPAPAPAGDCETCPTCGRAMPK
jgi:ParB-like chromosome segregation protein Spo0J